MRNYSELKVIIESLKGENEELNVNLYKAKEEIMKLNKFDEENHVLREKNREVEGFNKENLKKILEYQKYCEKVEFENVRAPVAGLREEVLKIGDMTLNLAIANGLVNAKKVLDRFIASSTSSIRQVRKIISLSKTIATMEYREVITEAEVLESINYSNVFTRS